MAPSTEPAKPAESTNSVRPPRPDPQQGPSDGPYPGATNDVNFIGFHSLFHQHIPARPSRALFVTGVGGWVTCATYSDYWFPYRTLAQPVVIPILSAADKMNGTEGRVRNEETLRRYTFGGLATGILGGGTRLEEASFGHVRTPSPRSKHTAKSSICDALHARHGWWLYGRCSRQLHELGRCRPRLAKGVL